MQSLHRNVSAVNISIYQNLVFVFRVNAYRKSVSTHAKLASTKKSKNSKKPKKKLKRKMPTLTTLPLSVDERFALIFSRRPSIVRIRRLSLVFRVTQVF